MADNNGGNGFEPRLKRVEEFIEVLTDAHIRLEGAHLRFEEEHQKLLTSQVLLTDRMDKLAGRMDQLAEAQIETEKRFTALMTVVDDLVRRPAPPAA